MTGRTFQPVPIWILTGFLGSGKTTLLRRVLCDPGFADTLVLINEFGEIGLDHHFVQAVDAELVLMTSGCICCSIRSDFARTLAQFAIGRFRKEGSRFARVILETTGVADPTTIVDTLLGDPTIRQHYRLEAIVTTVDGVHGAAQLDRHPEALRQACLADRLIITKTDIASPGLIAALQRRLRALCPLAAIQDNRGDADALFRCGSIHGADSGPELRRMFDRRATRIGAAAPPLQAYDHVQSIDTACLTWEPAIEWEAFAQWAERACLALGGDLLRIKGLLHICKSARPVAVHAVQHIFYPAVRLPEWPDDDRSSRVVIVTQHSSAREAIEGLRRALVQFSGSGIV